VAARLCALARPGQILTTKGTADLLGPGSHRRLGPRAVKNVAGAVDVVEIRPGRSNGEAPDSL
jgi:class 3 adenylate cyclase